MKEDGKTLVVLGKNIGAGFNGRRIAETPDHLSRHSKVTAYAAVELSQKEEYSTIIFSSGKTAGPDVPSEAEAMYQFAKQKGLNPKVNIILEERSHNTATNAQEVAKLLKSEQRIDLLTVGYHTKAAKKLHKEYGVHVEATISSENVAKDRAKNPDTFVQRFRNTSQVQSEVIKRA